MALDKHIHKRYDEELQNLQNLLMEMARLCESQLYSVSKYLRREANLDILENIEARMTASTNTTSILIKNVSASSPNVRLSPSTYAILPPVSISPPIWNASATNASKSRAS